MVTELYEHTCALQPPQVCVQQNPVKQDLVSACSIEPICRIAHRLEALAHLAAERQRQATRAKAYALQLVERGDLTRGITKGTPVLVEAAH
jgi:hypothetical protein